MKSGREVIKGEMEGKWKYRAGIIMPLHSYPDVYVRLLINPDQKLYDVLSRFKPPHDQLWIIVDQQVSQFQHINASYKILRRNGNVVECSVQYRDDRFENGTIIRCDNFEEKKPDHFHIEKRINAKSHRGKRAWKEDLIFKSTGMYCDNISRFKFCLYSVLDYVEKHYDELIGPKFFFPMYQHSGIDILNIIRDNKPKNISFYLFSDAVAAELLMKPPTKPKMLKEHLINIVVKIKKSFEEKGEYTIYLQGIVTMFPMPIFALPKSRIKLDMWSPKPMILKFKPLAAVFEKIAGNHNFTSLTQFIDTGQSPNPYPSIFGTHNGTIVPANDITVSKISIYPCVGTGGHAEYVRIWGNGLALMQLGMATVAKTGIFCTLTELSRLKREKNTISR